MKKHTDSLKPDTFYHNYNRGINGVPIFKKEKNYWYFLKKYIYYIDSVASTYSYCLMNNHFHFLINTKSEEEILETLTRLKTSPTIDIEKSISLLISKQFSNIFNSYTQAFNKDRGRTGGLFETPFRRIEINSDNYFSQLVVYIHLNPQKHGFVSDFRNYPFSSYNVLLGFLPTFLKRNEVINWFNGKEDFIKFHTEVSKGNFNNFYNENKFL